jgi:hypothetical protein
MPISVQCTQCGKSLKVPDTAAGKRGKCPCGAVLVIPAAGGIQTMPSAPPPGGARGAPRPSKSLGGPAAAPGTVTNPATFKKLFNGYLMCLGLMVLLGLILGVVMVLAVGSAASSVGSDLKAKQDYQQALFEWEIGGRKGPQPKMPETGGGSSGGMAGMIGSALGSCILPLIAIAAGVLGLIFVYKAWALIQDGNPRTSPGKAIGFLFIPFFSIYWMFPAYYGLAQDLNKYAQERGIEARPASEGMMLWGLILILAGFVVGCTAPIGAILLLIGFNSVKNTCMDIATAKIG